VHTLHERHFIRLLSFVTANAYRQHTHHVSVASNQCTHRCHASWLSRRALPTRVNLRLPPRDVSCLHMLHERRHFAQHSIPATATAGTRYVLAVCRPCPDMRPLLRPLLQHYAHGDGHHCYAHGSTGDGNCCAHSYGHYCSATPTGTATTATPTALQARTHTHTHTHTLSTQRGVFQCQQTNCNSIGVHTLTAKMREHHRCSQTPWGAPSETQVVVVAPVDIAEEVDIAGYMVTCGHR
jgi:hypothetical protein